MVLLTPRSREGSATIGGYEDHQDGAGDGEVVCSGPVIGTVSATSPSATCPTAIPAGHQPTSAGDEGLTLALRAEPPPMVDADRWGTFLVSLLLCRGTDAMLDFDNASSEASAVPTSAAGSPNLACCLRRCSCPRWDLQPVLRDPLLQRAQHAEGGEAVFRGGAVGRRTWTQLCVSRRSPTAPLWVRLFCAGGHASNLHGPHSSFHLLGSLHATLQITVQPLILISLL